MKIAILGLANSGKTTVFNALTGQDNPTTIYPTLEGEPKEAVVKVPDERLMVLAGYFEPKKITPATVHYLDYLGILRAEPQHNRKVLDFMKDADAYLHVVRAFKDEAVVHPFGGVDPARDLQALRAELILADLELVEKRLERIEDSKKKGKKPSAKEEKVLTKLRQALEEERPLREVPLTEEEKEAVRHLQFFTDKPEIVLLNLSEEEFQKDQGRKTIEEIRPLAGEGVPVLGVSGKIEMEIALLDEEERKEFLSDLGLSEPAMERVIKACYEHLGLISFFTAGPQEVRAWTIKKGTNAQKAAGKIHSDMERGFIRAEVIGYEDFINAGSVNEARQRGLFKLEGKEYIVQDGDIITFRFNV
ncbi:MAG: redox-regulated ATPase YchF [Nitrospirae bacterium]|nr:MAG: redox-regulated ATPase YchF [Nitrospirota bacterium]